MRSKNLLIICQTVDCDDSNLGFFCDWLREFSQQVDHLWVIANQVGRHILPANVSLLSLGKEDGLGRFGRGFRFCRYLTSYLPKVQGVFVHMCPEYVVYGGWLAKLYGKKIGLWYLHRSVTSLFLLSVKMVDYIFTAHQDGIGVRSDKVVVTGHGISLLSFKNLDRKPSPGQLDLLTVGRLSPSKDLLTLVKSVIILQSKSDKPVCLRIVGEPYLEEDQAYVKEVKKFIFDNNADHIFKFAGAVRHDEIAGCYARADIFISASRTGGVDKAVLEAIVSGLPVITSNSAFRNMLPKECVFTEGDAADLAVKLADYQSIPTAELKEKIMRENDLEVAIKNILKNLLN